MVKITSTVRSAFDLLRGFAKIAKKPFSWVAREYAILLRLMPIDVEDMIITTSWCAIDAN